MMTLHMRASLGSVSAVAAVFRFAAKTRVVEPPRRREKVGGKERENTEHQSKLAKELRDAGFFFQRRHRCGFPF